MTMMILLVKMAVVKTIMILLITMAVVKTMIILMTIALKKTPRAAMMDAVAAAVKRSKISTQKS